jgi:hypothetical protein
VWLREEQIRTGIDLLRVFIRDIITPLSGVALMVYLVATPGERSSYFVVAGGLITAPFVLAANARRITAKDADAAKEDA